MRIQNPASCNFLAQNSLLLKVIFSLINLKEEKIKKSNGKSLHINILSGISDRPTAKNMAMLFVGQISQPNSNNIALTKLGEWLRVLSGGIITRLTWRGTCMWQHWNYPPGSKRLSSKSTSQVSPRKCRPQEAGENILI